MHTQTIFELSQEAERLIHLAMHNLDMLKKIPLAVQENPSGLDGARIATIHPLHFSHKGVEVQQETLRNELRKVIHQEMVLAIVGTMKAGKSTTINAIVGTEVLPNRNRPMTALPTLIRHTPGQVEPVLYFPHVGPIETLMAELQKKLHVRRRDNLATQLEIDKDMDSLLLRIASGTRFEKQYLGAQPIFHCLKSLNDLVRLSKVLDVAFPFSAYTAIEHIPFIQVEFVHLAGMDQGLGQLTLLDTPGPNEAGQPHLQKMLQEQLASASAVLAVMDYTQLKSVSDEEVRQALSTVGKSVPLYALVNKFDQKDRNSDDEDQVRALISGTLMKGHIEPDHIFPVSSMWAYLANRARHELMHKGQLPPHTEQLWVQDFAEAALGRRWRTESLTDITALRHAAELLWEDSLFEQPIKTVLHAAHANASLYALRSASHKLLNYAQSAQTYMTFRRQGLDIASDQLQQSIVRLRQNIEELHSSRNGVRDEVQHEVAQALQGGAACIADYQRRMIESLSSYFRSGQIPEVSLSGIGRHDPHRRRDFEPGCQQMMLESESEARTQLHKIRASCDVIMLGFQEGLIRDLATLFSQLEITLTRTLRDALHPIETRVSDGLIQAGFKAHITLPVFSANQLNFNAHSLFNDAIDQQTLPLNHARRRGGMKGTVVRWLNSSEWGWEGYTASARRFVIDIPGLEQKLYQHIEQFSSQVRQAMDTQIDVSVSAGLASFFAEFSGALSSIEASLQQSLVARQQNEDALLALRKQLQQCNATAGFIYEDARLLRDDIQTLFAAEYGV